MNHYPNNKSNRSKKRRQEYVEDETEETVDDLAYAATFAAMMGPSSTTSNGVQQQDNHEQGDDDNDDSNEISVGEEEEDDVNKVVQNSPPQDKDEESESEEEDYGDVNDNNLDDDDDESDDELRGTNQTSIKQDKTIAPKTENEVDAYRTPIQELEKHLEFRLTVEDDQDTTSGSKKSRNLNSSNLILAGTVKHYMASDRTVVVESNPPVGGSSDSPLDEGNLLVLRPEQKQNSTGPKLIPLGRIFEVFGPVSRPLYTIRLPVPPSESKERGEDSVETKETEEDPKSSEREAQVPPDHWGPNGKYSLILADTNMVSVYFVQDEAKLLDTKKIMRNSGKGCGTLVVGLYFSFHKFMCLVIHLTHVLYFEIPYRCV